jgi:TPR repeat protein
MPTELTARTTGFTVAMDEVPMLRKDRFTNYRTEILMAAVAIITILAIWLVPSQREEAPPTLPQLTTVAPPTEAESASSSPADLTPASAMPGDRARAIIAGLRADGMEPDPVEVFVNAQQLQDEGHPDDAYLLYRYAANHGEAQAALLLGTRADPAYYKADGNILPAPEPEQAIKWYRIASAKGNAEAVARLQALRGRLEQASAAGDEQADRLLLLWQ